MEFFHSKTYYDTSNASREKREGPSNACQDYSMILSLITMIFGSAGDSSERKGEGTNGM